MNQITLNAPDNLHRSPNTGDGSEFGDNFYTVVANAQLNFSDLYTQVTALNTLNTNRTGVTAASSGVTIGASGTVTLNSLPNNYQLAAPAAGVIKNIVALTPTTAARTISTSTGGATILTTSLATANVITTTGVQSMQLIGLSSILWGVMQNLAVGATAAMSFSTS